MNKELKLTEVDLKCQEILLELGILKTTNGLTYVTYAPNVHIENLVAAMKKYAQFKTEQVGAVWVKASERLPEKSGIYFVKDDSGYNTACYKKKYYTDGDDLWGRNYPGGKPIIIEWLDESASSQPTDEAIEQDFKELRIYLNDIYDYYIRHKGKDAGNLCIQFSDKFNAFQKKITSMVKQTPVTDEAIVLMAEKYVNEQGLNYPISDSYKAMIKNQIKAAYKAGGQLKVEKHILSESKIIELAEKEYPYLQNEEDDIGTREYNQRMYDKREGFKSALNNKSVGLDGWIDVKDRLPEVQKRVLIITDYGGMDVCKWTGELWLNDMRAQHSNGGVTHWQPLPTPPQSK